MSVRSTYLTSEFDVSDADFQDEELVYLGKDNSTYIFARKGSTRPSAWTEGLWGNFLDAYEKHMKEERLKKLEKINE